MRYLLFTFLFIIQSFAFAWEPPTLISPSVDSNTESGVTFDWNAVTGSDGYVLQLDTINTFDSPVLFEKEEVYINSSNYNDDTDEYVDGLFFGTTYYWRVRAFSGTDSSSWAVSSFNVKDQLTFTSPVIGSTIETGLTLDWEAFSGVEYYDYQVDTTSNFNSPILIEGSNEYLNSSNYNDDTRQYIENLFFGKQYYWRIRARTVQDTSAWVTMNFSTKEQVELLSPNEGALLEAAATIDWDAHTGIDFYEYQIDTTAAFNSSVIIEGQNAYINSSNYNDDTHYYATNLFMDQVYFWRVRMINAADTSAWSQRSFITDTYIDLTNPSAEANVEVGVLLDWEAFSGSEYCDIQVDTSDLYNSSALITGENEATGTVNYNDDTEYFVSGLYFGVEYHWRVRARNSNDTSEWETSNFFTKDNVVLQSPNDQSIVENGVTLNWDAHSGVDFYQYQADTSMLFSSSALLEGENVYISGVNYNDDTEAYINDLYFGKTYYWRVRAGHSLDTSGYEMRSFITSNDVDIVSPDNNATNISTDGVTLNWDAHSGIDYYHLQIDSTNLYDNPIHDTLIAYISGVNYNDDTDFYLSGLAEETTYFWRLRVINAVDTSDWTERVFSTGDNVITTPDVPALEFPADNESFILPDLTFQWNDVADATSYEIAWSIEDNFAVAETMEVVASMYEVEDLLIDTTYFWRVRAMNGSIVSDWSSVYSFTTGINVPELISPLDGDINIDVDVVDLIWSNVESVTYKVQLAENPDFNPATNAATSTNEYTAIDLENYQNYYWRIQSVYDAYESKWSDINSFKTRLATPQLLTPDNDSTGIEPDSIVLHWQLVDSAESYIYQYTQISDFSTYVEGTSVDSFVLLPELNESNTYYWRIKAVKDEEESLWSTAYTFTTGVLTGNNGIEISEFKIYPIPAKDYIIIQSEFMPEHKKSVKLINALGNTIKVFDLSETEKRIDIADLQKGLYVIRIGNYQTKFIKE